MTKFLRKDGDGVVAGVTLKENAVFLSAAFHRSTSADLRNGFLAIIVAAPSKFSHEIEGSQLGREEEGQDQSVDALLSDDGEECGRHHGAELLWMWIFVSTSHPKSSDVVKTLAVFEL